jgi:hypothetical protein
VLQISYSEHVRHVTLRFGRRHSGHRELPSSARPQSWDDNHCGKIQAAFREIPTSLTACLALLRAGIGDSEWKICSMLRL